LATLALLTIFLFMLIFIRWNKELSKIEFFNEEADFIKAVTDLLRKAKISLYYCGGLGLIGDAKVWSDLLEEKLRDENFIVNRLIDLKHYRDIKELLKCSMQKNELDDTMRKYKEWLTKHATYVFPKHNSFFFDFDGAPIWKYAIHYMIFDKRHIVIAFPSIGMHNNGIILRDRPDESNALIDCIETLKKFLRKKPLTADEILDRTKENSEENPHEEKS